MLSRTGIAVIYQQDDYYPFGLEISRNAFSPKNEYLYNKKELQEEPPILARVCSAGQKRWHICAPLPVNELCHGAHFLHYT